MNDMSFKDWFRVEDKPYEQIAQELGIPIKTAGRRLFTARQRLKEKLQRHQ